MTLLPRLLTASALLSLANAETTPLQDWFTASFTGETPTPPSQTLTLDQLEESRSKIFQSYKKAALANDWDQKFIPPNTLEKPEDGRLQLKSGKYKIAEGLEMPYLSIQKGTKPPNGWPLAIAMHGGGGTGDKLPHPHAWPVNTREWNAQIKLSISLYPSNVIYFIPRMVDDNQGRWWKEFNYEAFQALIRHAILFWDVDPNRIYLMGISEGGYGTETLAARYPEKFAAANGLACGSGTSIHLENLRNLPFRTDVGENDTAFGRRPNAVKKHALLDQYRAEDPEGYTNHLEVHQGRGHGINYKPGPAWMMDFTRNPQPEKITYTLFQHDKSKNKGAYWLQAVNDLDKKIIYLEAETNPETNSIEIAAQATVKDETVQSADHQRPLADPGKLTAASGLKLRLWLHESLLDLSKPVEVIINGKTVTTFTPELNTSIMAESLLEFHDPESIYPSKVEVIVP